MKSRLKPYQQFNLTNRLVPNHHQPLTTPTPPITTPTHPNHPSPPKYLHPTPTPSHTHTHTHPQIPAHHAPHILTNTHRYSQHDHPDSNSECSTRPPVQQHYVCDSSKKNLGIEGTPTTQLSEVGGGGCWGRESGEIGGIGGSRREGYVREVGHAVQGFTLEDYKLESTHMSRNHQAHSQSLTQPQLTKQLPKKPPITNPTQPQLRMPKIKPSSRYHHLDIDIDIDADAVDEDNIGHRYSMPLCGKNPQRYFLETCRLGMDGGVGGRDGKEGSGKEGGSLKEGGKVELNKVQQDWHKKQQQLLQQLSQKQQTITTLTKTITTLHQKLQLQSEPTTPKSDDSIKNLLSLKMQLDRYMAINRELEEKLQMERRTIVDERAQRERECLGQTQERGRFGREVGELRGEVGRVGEENLGMRRKIQVQQGIMESMKRDMDNEIKKNEKILEDFKIMLIQKMQTILTPTFSHISDLQSRLGLIHQKTWNLSIRLKQPKLLTKPTTETEQIQVQTQSQFQILTSEAQTQTQPSPQTQNLNLNQKNNNMAEGQNQNQISKFVAIMDMRCKEFICHLSSNHEGFDDMRQGDKKILTEETIQEEVDVGQSKNKDKFEGLLTNFQTIFNMTQKLQKQTKNLSSQITTLQSQKQQEHQQKIATILKLQNSNNMIQQLQQELDNSFNMMTSTDEKLKELEQMLVQEYQCFSETCEEAIRAKLAILNRKYQHMGEEEVEELGYEQAEVEVDLDQRIDKHGQNDKQNEIEKEEQQRELRELEEEQRKEEEDLELAEGE